MAENITGMESSSWGGKVQSEVAVRLPADAGGLLAQKDLGLHRLSQGVNGGVGDLGGVDEDLVPVHRKGAWGCP